MTSLLLRYSATPEPFEETRRPDRGLCCLSPFVVFVGGASCEGVRGFANGQDAEADRDTGVEHDSHQPFRSAVRDVLVVVGLSFHNGTKDDDRVVAVLGHVLRHERSLESPFYVDDGDVVRSRFIEEGERPDQEAIGHRPIEQGTHHADTKIGRIEVPTKLLGHDVEPRWPSFVALVRR